ncbi:MAG: hypothetical protein EP305_07555 [Bacteroidetes bacterium]|nr:MAG: hypothetical protein EP305_07555 [Bacteroidota bacterium]
MKTEPMTNIIKTILFFGLISIGVDLIRKLIFVQLDLSKIFNLDFLLYEVVLEFVFLIITAFATHLLSKSIVINNLGTSLLKASIFGVIYGIVSLISTRIISLSMGAGIGFQFDIYDSFIKYIPNGIMEGILLMLVINHLNPKNNN